MGVLLYKPGHRLDVQPPLYLNIAQVYNINYLPVSFQVLMKWGEYSNDVQFILQRSTGSTPNTTNNRPHPLSPITPPASPCEPSNFHERNKDIRKSLTFSGASNLVEHRRSDNGGNVRGVAQQPQSPQAATASNNNLHVKEKESDPHVSVPNTSQSYSPSHQVCFFFLACLTENV